MAARPHRHIALRGGAVPAPTSPAPTILTTQAGVVLTTQAGVPLTTQS